MLYTKVYSLLAPFALTLWQAEVGSVRLTSLERVTTGVGSVSRGARAKPNSHGRSLRPTLPVGSVRFVKKKHWGVADRREG